MIDITKNQKEAFMFFIKKYYAESKLIFFAIFMFSSLSVVFEALGLITIASVFNNYQENLRFIPYFDKIGSLLSDNHSYYMKIIIPVLFFGTFRYLFVFFAKTMQGMLEKRMYIRVKHDTFSQCLHLNYQKYISYPLGELITIVENHAASMIPFTAMLIDVLSLVFTICFYLFLSLRVSFYQSIISLVFFGALLFIAKIALKRKIEKVSVEKNKQRIELNNITVDFLSGFRDIVLAGLESRAEKMHERAVQSFSFVHLRHVVLKSLSDLIVGILSIFCISTVIYFIFINATSQNQAIADTLIIIGIFARLVGPAQSVLLMFFNMFEMFPALEKLHEILIEKRGMHLSFKQETDITLKKGIEFKNVSFCYHGSDKKILDDATFDIPAGKRTLIVGRSGEGKTTILNLIAGLLSAISGEIRFDGQNIKNVGTVNLRRLISFVSQKTFLFSGTLKENLTFFSEQELSDAVLKQAAEVAQAEEFIKGFEDGLDTNIGQNGAFLSGGQQQRISIIRALLRKSSILIFDEATNNVDRETEMAINEAIQNLRGKTIIIITHSLANIRYADHLLSLDNGKVIQIDKTHESFNSFMLEGSI